MLENSACVSWIVNMSSPRVNSYSFIPFATLTCTSCPNINSKKQYLHSLLPNPDEGHVFDNSIEKSIESDESNSFQVGLCVVGSSGEVHVMRINTEKEEQKENSFLLLDQEIS